MKSTSAGIRLSASDLSNHLACRHLTALDLAVVAGQRPAPTWNSPDAWVLQQRGIAHENAYIQDLESQGLSIVNLREVENSEQAVADTIAAMQSGPDVVVQAALAEGNWFGRPDVLRRVERPSNLAVGLMRSMTASSLARPKLPRFFSCRYTPSFSERSKGCSRSRMYVVPPGEPYQPEQYRVLDYAAYYRYVKSRLQTAVNGNGRSPLTYPEPTPHCEVCRWRLDCETERRKDDHLSLVAGISRLQRKQLQVWDTLTVAELGRFPLPIQHRPDHGSKEGYVRVREQARVQVAGREEGRPVHEVLEITDEHGLSLLPEPSAGDIFFDLEGDPFVGLSGREYLFGMVLEDAAGEPKYECRWALNATDEKEDLRGSWIQ